MHQILGSVLQRDSALPKLVCRSCERKIRNAGILKQTIANTQELFAKKKTRAKDALMYRRVTFNRNKKRARVGLQHPGWKAKIQQEEVLGFVKQVYPIQR